MQHTLCALSLVVCFPIHNYKKNDTLVRVILKANALSHEIDVECEEYLKIPELQQLLREAKDLF